MLKAYLDREANPQSSVSAVKAVVALSSAEMIDEAPVVALSSAEMIEAQTTVVLSGADSAVAPTALTMSDGEDVVGPSCAVVQGRLENSEILSKLDERFPHLTPIQHEDVVSLISSHISLFSDVPTKTMCCSMTLM